MTISIDQVNAGNTGVKLSGTTLDVVVTATIAVGKYAILSVVFDNIQTTDGGSTNASVTDARGNTWVRDYERTNAMGSANQGVAVGIFRSQITTQLEVNDLVTVTFTSAITAKGAGLCSFTTTSTLSVEVSDFQQVTSTDYTVTTTTGSSAHTLWFGVNGAEAGSGSNNTVDSAFTQIAGGAFGCSGGSQVSNIGARAGYVISTATSETYDRTVQVNADRLTVLIAYRELGVGGSNLVIQNATHAMTFGSPGAPLGIPGLVYWFNADAIPVNDGDTVQTWPDWSGNGRDLTQATLANRPIVVDNAVNGHRTVRFDGTDDSMATATFSPVEAQPNTLFVVLMRPSFPAAATVCSGRDQNNHNAIRIAGSNQNKLTYNSPDDKNDGAITASVFYVVSAIYEGATSKLFSNGVDVTPVGDPGSQSLNGVTVGSAYTQASGFFNGDIAEYLLYDSRLIDGYRRIVEAYLGAKYGIAVT